MKIGKKDVTAAAQRLALPITEQESARIVSRLPLAEYALIFSAMSLQDIKPMTQVHGDPVSLREDQVVPGLTPGEALTGAESKQSMFVARGKEV